jgi:hypothetical protein
VALTVFKTVRDLTMSGWVGSIPMHSRHAAPAGRDSPRGNYPAHLVNPLPRLATLAGLAIVAVLPLGGVLQPLAAQRPDSARLSAPDTVAADSVKPPLTPKRAFLYSFIAPGLGQSILGRHKAAAGFLLVEAISAIMIRESSADVQEARRIANDSVVVSYVDGLGNVLATPRVDAPQFNSAYVHARQAHVEDWIALLVANHLLAGADAFVAANLWDVGAHLGLRLAPGSATMSASFKLR